MTRYSPTIVLDGNVTWTGSVPDVSGNRLSTGTGRCTHAGSSPSTRAVTPSMTFDVLDDVDLDDDHLAGDGRYVGGPHFSPHVSPL